MGGQLLRHARHGRPLAQGRAGPAAAAGPKGGARPLQAPGTLLGIQRRAHQPARAGAAAPVPPAACPRSSSSACCGRSAAATASLAGLRRRLGRAAAASAACRRCRAASHWGAGVSISARDQARIGQLVLDGGRAGGRRCLPREWIERMQRAVRDRAVLRPAALAESRRPRLPGRVDATLCSWSAPAATTSASTRRSTPWWCCAGSTRRTRRRRSALPPPRSLRADRRSSPGRSR